MIIIPQINYIISMLPLDFPLPLLSRFNWAISGFLWMGKKPAFNKKKLYASVEEGGLGFPRIDWYHLAFNLSQLSKSNVPEGS